MGILFDRFYMSIFALANTMFWRMSLKNNTFFTGGDHSPTSCFIASVTIFAMLFAVFGFINNIVIEGILSIALALFFRKWKI